MTSLESIRATEASTEPLASAEVADFVESLKRIESGELPEEERPRAEVTATFTEKPVVPVAHQQVVSHLLRNDLSVEARRAITKDPAIKAAAVAAVEWVCASLNNSTGAKMVIDMPIGSMEFPIVEWKEDMTLLTIVAYEDSFKFTPKYGTDLNIRIVDGDVEKEFFVVYGGGTVTIQGLPVVIISFLVHNLAHGETR